METNDSLKRNLKSRHITMMAIGSSVGTGLFLASGSMISESGPGGALLGYILVGFAVYLVMNGLGEMSTYNPVSGSIMTFSKEYVDKSLGFSVGWIYYYMEISGIILEISTAGILMKFWFPEHPLWIFTIIFFVLMLFINLLGVKIFGEVEFWMTTIKVVTIIVFIILGLLIIFGFIGTNPLGFSNFFYKGGPFIGNISSFFSILLLCALSFGGTELIGVVAGESENPSKSIPKAINNTIFRILIFYIGTMFIVGAMIPYDSTNLLGSHSNLAISPFTLLFSYAHLPAVESIMNFIILTVVISAGNAAFYASTRMLYSLGKEGYGSKKFLLSKNGIPFFSIMISLIIGIVCVLIGILGYEAYLILIEGTGICYLILWSCMGLAHYRFRKAYIRQGLDLNKLKFKGKLFPIGPIIIVCFFIGILLYNLILGLLTDWIITLNLYISVIIFIVLFVYYKLKYKTKLIPLEKINLENTNE
ncbi:MAG: amino acid permease [Methanobrevibacter sp.]|nr:amino acid permease [Methanobrevibacter sp.]